MLGALHRIKEDEDLPRLAEMFYGNSDNWKHIYWANIGLYGDDFEAVMAGSLVYIPDIETANKRVILTGEVLPNAVQEAAYNPLGLRQARYSPDGRGFRIVRTESGHAELLFSFEDVSTIKAGLLGIEYAAERLTVSGYGSLTESPTAGTLSNAKGDTLKTYGDQDTPGTGFDGTGVPSAPDIEVPEGESYPTNLLRKAVVDYYGYHYMYYPVLWFNDTEETDIFKSGQEFTMPARGKRAQISEAVKWAKRLGYY